MRQLIFATVFGAALTLNTQAATPRSENKAQYEQGRKSPEYKKENWEKRSPAKYETKKSDFKHNRWERKEGREMRHDVRGRGRWENEHRHNRKSNSKQCHHNSQGRK